MIDALKMLATESTTDPKVKKKLISVLGAWHTQFKDDPSMSNVANLYNLVKPSAPQRRVAPPAPVPSAPAFNRPEDDFNFDVEPRRSRDEVRRMEEESRKEEKRRAKEAKEAAKRKALEEEEERRKARIAAANKPKRKPFNFEQVFFSLLFAFSRLTHQLSRRNHRFSPPLPTLQPRLITSSMPLRSAFSHKQRHLFFTYV
jgi:LAS seventeen-binding protein 5